MTYRPAETVFGPPLSVRLPSFIYLGIAAVVAALVLMGEMSEPGSFLHYYVVEKDINRLVSSRALGVVLLISALASVVRAGMRGVRIRGDGIEFRDVISIVMPRVRRYKWAQIDRIVLDQQSIAVDLWDGTRALLPRVGDRLGLAAALEKVAHARAIPVRGGRGLDEIPEANEFDEDEGA
jgi:hypothetical protein